MFTSSLVLKAGVGLAVAAGSLAAYHSLDVGAGPGASEEPAPPPASELVDPHTPTPGGSAGIHVDEDTMRLQLGGDGHGEAGVEVGADGMRIWLEGEDPEGRQGAAGMGMDDDGMRMWLDGGS